MSIYIVPDTPMNSTKNYVAPGLVQGCFNVDSLFRSTLECFYNGSECFQVMMYKVYTQTRDERLLTNIGPLIHDPALTHFSPNSLFSLIAEQMMIEKWNQSFFFDRYYQACAPNYCTYSFTTRAADFAGIILILLSTIGGLIAALRVVTPLMINCVFRLLQTKRRSPSTGKKTK